MRKINFNLILSFLAIQCVLGLATFGRASAQVVNSQGTSGAPIAVSNSVKTVLLYQSGRKAWCVEPETVTIRCEPSPTSAAPATTPTTTVGFLFPSGIVSCHNTVPIVAATDNAQAIRLDCISTGSSTSVDTWEE